MDMPKLKIGRYDAKQTTNFAGYVEPEDRSWILFVGRDGKPVLFTDRDPKTGAVLSLPGQVPSDPTK